MTAATIKGAFAKGEISPGLYGRVDQDAYQVGAKLLRNFFVLPQGGAANRAGTRFVGRAKDSSHPVRLIPFQFSTVQTYVLEFGHQYMRVIMDGGYVLEPSLPVTGISNASPCQVSYAATTLTAATPDNGGVTTSYAPGDTVTLAGGTSSQAAILTVTATALLSATVNAGGTGYAVGDTITLAGGGATTPAVVKVTAVSSGAVTAFTVQTAGAYQINAASFTQASTSGAGTGATFSAPIFGVGTLAVTVGGSYSATPADPVAQAATSGAGAGLAVSATWGPLEPFAVGDWVFVAGVQGMVEVNSTPAKVYVVSAVAGSTVTLATLDGQPVDTTALGAYAGGGTLARIYTLATPYAGADLALVKYTQSADVMTLCHPAYAPADLSRTEHWRWTLAPVSFAPGIEPPAGVTATPKGGPGSQYYAYVVTAVMGLPMEESLASVSASCQNAALNQNTGVVNTISWAPVAGAVSYRVYKAPVGTTGPVPDGAFYGYIGATSATSFDDANILPDTTQTPPEGQDPFAGGNWPGVVTYFQQRKVFGGSAKSPETLWMTQPGNYTNMDTSSPSVASDAITMTLASREVNAIKHVLPMTALIALTASGAWLISGGSQSDAVTPTQIVAQPQVYSGCSDVPPLVVNYDVLYVQFMGNVVRDMAWNFYANVYTGADVSILSAHLFQGYRVVEWAYAEVPNSIVWAVRDDGQMLSLTYVKAQEMVAWAHHDTQGAFLSVVQVQEPPENAVYVVVSRTVPGVNGGQPVQYVERMAARDLSGVDVTQAWFVDCGLQYQGAPTTTVTGLDHLEGCTVAILADGNVEPAQVVTKGAVGVSHAASTITVGLPYVSQLETLPVDLGTPTVQGRRKKLSAVTVRVWNSRGLKVGPDAQHLAEVKERNRQAYGQPIGLVTGDERVLIPPSWNTDGSVWVEQDYPLPATVLALIPEIRVGDTP